MTINTLESLYLDTINKLKNDQRPQIKLTSELIELLKSEWLKSPHMVFCILGNTQNSTSEFNELFISTFKSTQNDETLIFLLAASEKHLVAESLRTGNMIPAEYFVILKKLLAHKSPEVLEWTLRVIESMGPLNIRLKEEVLKSKPNWKKIFNSNLKACDDIINLLEMQWKRKL
jgi:hypothetical protein